MQSVGAVFPNGPEQDGHLMNPRGQPLYRSGKLVKVPAWKGRPKGMAQVLWERGLWVCGMLVDVKESEEGSGMDSKGRKVWHASSVVFH